MYRNVLEFLMNMKRDEPRADVSSFRDIVDVFGDLEMRIPRDARMSDNVIDRRDGKTPEEPPYELPDNIEPGTGSWKAMSEQPPIPEMFAEDVMRVIRESGPGGTEYMNASRTSREPGGMDRKEMQDLIDAIMGGGPNRTPTDAQYAPLMRLLGMR
jgi:hypothetical protein